MLTVKQKNLLTYISDKISKDGVAPSYDEMREAVGLKSKSGIHRLVAALEERAFIRRLPHRARAIEVIRLPEDLTRSREERLAAHNSRGAITNLADETEQADGNHTISLPLYGKIAAGTPIEALSDYSKNVDVSPNMLGNGDHYALEVSGDSMIESGILDGDTVIIRRAEQANNGDIVVALVDGEEATLKTFQNMGAEIALKPSNIDYETQYFAPSRVRIQGHLVGLLRHY